MDVVERMAVLRVELRRGKAAPAGHLILMVKDLMERVGAPTS